MRRVRRNDERSVEEDPFGVPTTDFMQFPIFLRVACIPVESRAICEFMQKRRHSVYITSIYMAGKVFGSVVPSARIWQTIKVAVAPRPGLFLAP
jgi:hypothetical protein